MRFVQLYHTTGGFQPWDQHSDLKGGHAKNALATDLPIAGLLQDLKARGLLEDTLVIWGGEFGRTPAAEGDRRPRSSPLRLHHVASRRRSSRRDGSRRDR